MSATSLGARSFHGGSCTPRRARSSAGAVLIALMALVVLGAAPAVAQDIGAFGAAFDAALANDAEYRASRFELEAREQAAPIARAGLLPNVSASYANSQVRGERESLNTLGQDFNQRLDYRTPMWALQLRTPLLDMQAFKRYESARSQVDGARFVFVARGYELLDRFAGAYVQRLLAEEVLSLAQAQVEALELQRDFAERRFRGGEATRTDIAEAAAGLAISRAQRIEALDQRDVAQRTLARITGVAAPPLRGLPPAPTSVTLPAIEVVEWITLAGVQNPGLQARRYLLESARYEAERNRAGHLPRVDLVASAMDSQNESISTLNQRVRQYNVGVQVNLPLFAGGAVDAGVTQAQAEVSRLQAQVDGDLETLDVDIRRQHQLMTTGQTKAEALQQAVVAGAVALEGNQRGLSSGVKTTMDVVEATRRLFVTRRDLAQARYEALLARLRLQSLAGLPLAQVVLDIDKLMTAQLQSRPAMTVLR